MSPRDEMLKEYDVKRKNAGFFLGLYKEICGEMSKDEVDYVDTIIDNREEMIRFSYNLKPQKEKMKITESFPQKDPKLAKQMKENGTIAFSQGKDLVALTFYTQGVILTPVNSKDFSLNLANRSAVLFSLKWYKEALADIELALQSGYPDNLCYKLHHRRGKIQLAYRLFAEAERSFQKALDNLDSATKLGAEQKAKLKSELSQGILFCQKPPKNVKPLSQAAAHPPLRVEEKNPLYPAISKAVGIKYTKNRGRYAVAERDIKIGEILVVEEPLVTCTLPEYTGQSCSCCFISMRAPLPCTHCTQVLFCSLECRNKALSGFHRYECKLANFFTEAGMSAICFLAYRAVTQKSVKWFMAKKEKLAPRDMSLPLKDVYLSSDYNNFYNLVTHRAEMTVTEVFHRAMFSVFLVKCLQSQGYFSDPPADAPNEEQIYIGVLLNHFLEVLQFNAHEVAQFEMQGKRFQDGGRSEFIGAGVYPTLALFNHSCEPCVIRIYSKDVVMVQAIKPIKKGDEVSENYGPIFFHSEKADRHERLKKQYWFTCVCPPCEEDWPLLSNMNTQELVFRCRGCGEGVTCSATVAATSLKCSSCGTGLNLLQALKTITDLGEMVEKGTELLQEQKLAEAQAVYCKYVEEMDALLFPPYQDFYKIQQNFWKCSWLRFGNRLLSGGVTVAKPQQSLGLD